MEMNASRPLAEQVANLRGQIVAEIRRMLEADTAGLAQATISAAVGLGS